MTFARTLQCSFSELCINFLVLESCGKGGGGGGEGDSHVKRLGVLVIPLYGVNILGSVLLFRVLNTRQ